MCVAKYQRYVAMFVCYTLGRRHVHIMPGLVFVARPLLPLDSVRGSAAAEFRRGSWQLGKEERDGQGEAGGAMTMI